MNISKIIRFINNFNRKNYIKNHFVDKDEQDDDLRNDFIEIVVFYKNKQIKNILLNEQDLFFLQYKGGRNIKTNYYET